MFMNGRNSEALYCRAADSPAQPDRTTAKAATIASARILLLPFVKNGADCIRSAYCIQPTGADLVNFQEERFADVIGEAMPLLERHWEEIARNRDTIPLRPDYVRYAALDERGHLLICTARSGPRLVGYAVYLVDRAAHYVTTLWATSDIFWVAPEHRSGRTGFRLLQFAEGSLKSRGVTVMQTRAKNDHPAAGRLLEHLGHVPIETVYAKVLV